MIVHCLAVCPLPQVFVEDWCFPPACLESCDLESIGMVEIFPSQSHLNGGENAGTGTRRRRASNQTARLVCNLNIAHLHQLAKEIREDMSS
jgi:hypothetical protein